MVEQKKRVNIIGEKQKRDYRTNRVTVTWEQTYKL